ncbi:biofilm regulation phosphoprotein SiaC [Ectothiorhodospira mobilis]|uniref:biofilm regulation phosphoprotein SiaC n=1 Tax=Ectothiorhodospira mobilis TaxID=195064 RepID=UPI001A91C3C5|nr:biofilm regulation phosphoprotein SiaC [Ectothiorhodospira mobilis]
MASLINDLEIQGTQSTPVVTSDWSRGCLQMEGNSYPENSFEFFSGIFSWIERYLDEGAEPLCLELALIYMNTSSVKAMMDIFDLMEEAHGRGREVRVRWYFDPRNERVMEMAEEFREDYTFSFDILPREG